MPVVVDLTGVSASGPPPLEPDIYPATISKAEVKPSKSSGEDTLYLTLVVSYVNEEEEEDERTFSWNTSLQKKQLHRLKLLLLRLGVDVPDGPLEFDEQDLVGVECRVRLTQEKHYRDENRMTNRVAEILGTEDDPEEGWG